MSPIETVIGILLFIMAIFLIISILMQSGKSKKLSGTIAGGAETFFGKQKGQAIDKTLSKVTNVVALVFVILILILLFIDAKPEEAPAASGNNNIKTESTANPDDKEEVSGEEADVSNDSNKTESTPAATDSKVESDTAAPVAPESGDAGATDAENSK